MLKAITRTEAYPTGKEDDPGYAIITVYDGLTEEDWNKMAHLSIVDRGKVLGLDSPDDYLIPPGALYCESVRILCFTRTCVVVERRYNYNI